MPSMPTTYIIGHQKPDTDSVVSAMAYQYLCQQLDCLGYKNPQAVIADPINHETKYLLDRFDVEAPNLIAETNFAPDDQLVLVDHNEESQRWEGIQPGQIVEIIDHHKPNLNLSQPIFLNFKVWGSTTSIIYFMMKHFADEPVQPDKKLAGLMLAAILSDTVGLKSTTTTENDRQLADELAQLAGIKDLKAFTLDIFKAKSNLDDLTPKQMVKNDYKIYEFSQKTLIGQLETVEQEKILSEQKQDLLEAMQVVKQEDEVDLIYLAVSDIMQVNTKLLIAGDQEQQAAIKAFGGEIKDSVLDIGPKLSRKKEIAPTLEKTLAAM